MKTLYFGCEMGAAGDMLMAALYELLPDKRPFCDAMEHLLPGVTVHPEESVKCGIRGTHMAVSVHGEEEAADGAHVYHAHEHDHEQEHDHDHHAHDHDHAHRHTHSGAADVFALIERLDLPDGVKANVRAVYESIAEAESRVHGVPVAEVHFHEVGALDAVADVAGVCLLIDLLRPERILASPVHVGAGQVRCAHGLLPVPAPATALLLEGIPIYGGSIRGELSTPTGAALLRHFVDEFGDMPVMRPIRTGYGMGKKDFEAANCVRAVWGETEEGAEDVLELRCNLDDMTAEAIGFAQERLREAGALDVYTVPIGMKKDRPGVLLTCLCRPSRREAMLGLLFRHTTTLGVRELRCTRSTLARREETAETAFGPVNVKVSEGWGVVRRKAEYEDLARIAREKGLGLEEIRGKLGL